MGAIEHLFKLLNNESLFCLKIKEKNICMLCKETVEVEKFLSSLITINKTDIKYNSLNDLILNKKITTFSICENCSYDNEKKINAI